MEAALPSPYPRGNTSSTRFLQEGIQKETVPEFETEPGTLLPGNFKILTLLPFWGLHVIWHHGSIFSGLNVIGKHSALAVSIYALFFVENPAKVSNIFFLFFTIAGAFCKRCINVAAARPVCDIHSPSCRYSYNCLYLQDIITNTKNKLNL